jgi:long-subunit acyl-CoA synthetase (AMP-forming)
MVVIMADGAYSPDELVWWKSMQNVHPLFRDVPPHVFNPMQQRVKAQLTSQTPWRQLVDQWAKAVLQQYKELILELAADLATVDKNVSGKEPEVITYLGKAMGLTDDTVSRIFMSKISRI